MSDNTETIPSLNEIANSHTAIDFKRQMTDITYLIEDEKLQQALSTLNSFQYFVNIQDLNETIDKLSKEYIRLDGDDNVKAWLKIFTTEDEVTEHLGWDKNQPQVDSMKVRQVSLEAFKIFLRNKLGFTSVPTKEDRADTAPQP